MHKGLHRRLFYGRIFLIIYSLICTAWLIIRTGRRPSRFTYPCQRAAASQSLWLWSYIIGSSSSFISKLFRHQNALPRMKDFAAELAEFKRLILAAVLMTVIFMFSFNQPGVIQNQNAIWESPARQSSPLPNLPSTSRLADSFRSNSIVTVIGSDNPVLSQPTGLDQILSYNQVKDMVWTALQADTSSKCLKNIINDSDWVVIKPNIVTAPIKTISGSPVTYYWYQGIRHKGQNTDLRVVKSVIEYLVQHKNLRRISIAEGSGEWSKLGESGTDPNMAMDGWTVHWPEYDNLSYEQIRDEINSILPGLVDLVDLSYDGYRYVEVPDPFQSGIGGLQRSGYYMPNTVLDCDKWIDIAVMKTHSIPGLSLAMKLRIGTLANQAYGPPQEGYMELHSFGEQGVKQAIVDMYSYRPADYAIVEGIWSTEGDGPQWGNDLKRNVIVAGRNAVAVDAIGAAIMGYNPWDLDYLHFAAMKKLGTFNLQQIDVMGDSIDHVTVNFTKPLMSPDDTPYVGRGNREWLINGVYSSTDLNSDFLGNESSIQPYQGMISGENNWQIYESPTDKIDLKQVFGESADNCIIYAFIYINSSKNISTNLWLGVDDGIKLWVNGEVVFSNDQSGGYAFPEQKIPILLNRGTNTILCKILNYSQDFEFRMNTSDNDGDTPLVIEYLTAPPNIAPEVPQLLLPSNNAFLANHSPKLSWTIPTDGNGDSLHFLVQVSSDSNFTSNLQSFDSYLNNLGFSPTPPVPEGSDTMYFEIQNPLFDDQYWWRISAWDGIRYSEFSIPHQFTVDTTLPEISNLGWQNPGYGENWYNQRDTAIARLKINYSEINVDSLVVDINGLGNPLLYTALPEGTEQTFFTQIEIQTASDGSYPIVVQLWDRAGNCTNDTILIKLDSTIPINTRASSPDKSITELFIVSWANSGSDRDGVGLSGWYDVRFKVDSGQWQDWLINFEGVSDTFKFGQQGHTYHFEAAARDYLGNREAFTGTSESSTLVDTTAANIAPQQPGLISPAHRKFMNTTTPKLSWTVPVDGNGDSLHFSLQLSEDSTFSSSVRSYSSIHNVSQFSPAPPYQQGEGTVQFTFAEQLAETVYWWRVSAYDRLENGSFSDPFCFHIDVTPPKGAYASSPDTSRTTTFTVDWQNTASDNGSGLAGTYDIQVKIDNGQFEIWKVQYESTSCEFSGGRHGHRYAFEVAAWDRAGNREAFTGTAESTTFVDTLTSAVKDYRTTSQLPGDYYLKQNHPNPFNNSTWIEFGLPKAGRVRLTIYDLMGRTIKNILYEQTMPPGIHRFSWDGADNFGNRVASSLYFYRIEVNGFVEIKKLMFVK